MTFEKWASKFYVYAWDDESFVGEASTLKDALALANKTKDDRIITLRKAKDGDDWNLIWFYSSDDKTWFQPSPDEALRALEADPKLVKELPVAQLEVLIKVAKWYYTNSDEPLLSDKVYDRMEDALRKAHPKASVLKQVGAPVPDKAERSKVNLPFHLGSMDKKYSFITDLKKKQIEQCVSEKLDGASLLYDWTKGDKPGLYTRGDGDVGQDVSHLIPKLKKLPKIKKGWSVRCEAILDKATFEKKFKGEFKVARNMVSGLLNRLDDTDHAAYAHIDIVGIRVMAPLMKQSEQFKWMEKQGFQVPKWQVIKLPTEGLYINILKALKEKSKHQIDGLVSVNNDKAYPPEKNGNPKYAFAFKANNAEDSRYAEVVSIDWALSRHGQWKPTLVIKEPSDKRYRNKK